MVDQAIEQLDFLATGYVCEIVILVVDLLYINQVRSNEVYHEILSGVIDSSHNNRIATNFATIDS